MADFHMAGRSESIRRVDALRRTNLLRGRVLDVGCATGSFLEAARPYVTGTVGVEPDPAHRTFAQGRGLAVVAALDETPEGVHDLVVLFHVLEHVPDPVSFLRKASSKLAPAGTIVVEAPNVRDALLTRFGIGAFAAHYWQPAHLFYFSPATLERVACESGLDASIEPLQRYSLSNHLHWAIHGRPFGRRRYDWISEATEESYAADLCRSHVSDTLWMVARRHYTGVGAG